MYKLVAQIEHNRKAQTVTLSFHDDQSQDATDLELDIGQRLYDTVAEFYDMIREDMPALMEN